MNGFLFADNQELQMPVVIADLVVMILMPNLQLNFIQE
jgi:hypothetical protein